MRKIAFLLVFVSGCGIADAHRAADKRIFDAVAPEIQQYWANDPKLDKHQVERRERLLRSWKLLVETGEEKEPKGDEELPPPKDGSK